MNAIKRTTIKVLSAVLPEFIKNSLLHMSYNLSPIEFERFAHTYCIGPSMNFGLRSVASRGFAPKCIVDVGAYEGEWSKLAKSIWPESNLFMFEPNSSKKEKLAKVANELQGKLFDNLLGAKNGEHVQFNIMETGSSIMSERSPAYRNVETRILTTIDSLGINFEAPGLLKIDAQGYELEILKGATDILPSFEAVLLEVALIEINEGAPLLYEVSAFMGELGFVACEILEVHRRPLDRAMTQIDILFVRSGSDLLSEKRYAIAR
jgi:FkbM family methyltransferase